MREEKGRAGNVSEATKDWIILIRTYSTFMNRAINEGCLFI